jgi:NADPH-dependent curcumin reductase CurA
MNPHGRIPICGMISWYNAVGLGAGADAEMMAPALWRPILVKFLSVNGFIISNHWDRFPAFLSEIGPKVASGEIKVVEDIAEGLQNAPAAFMGLLEGKNVGKQIVHVGPA